MLSQPRSAATIAELKSAVVAYINGLIPDQIARIMQACWEYDPVKRPGLDDILACVV
jgi:hypothetical protein